MNTESLQFGTMAIGLFGGLALFLFGMDQMTTALKEVAGTRMKAILAQMTKNRFRGLLTGAFVTAIIQSSSVTTVLTVGFVQSGLMSLQQSIGIIMGASIGTTATAQIIAFKVTKLALVGVAVGFLMKAVSGNGRAALHGTIILGLGLVFLGMNVMGEAMSPLRTWQPFLDVMRDYSGPWIGLLIGAVFTALVQSSSATTGVIIVMATQGIMPLETGLALAIGANLGTTVTAMLAAIGKRAEAVQTALAYFFFKLVSSIAWVFLLLPLAEIGRWMSPAYPGLEGVALMAAETPRQIANAYTLLNVLNAAVFIWFSGPLAQLVQRLVPVRPDPERDFARPRYLDNALLDTPDLALERVRLELGRLAKRVHQFIAAGPRLVFEGNRDDIERVAEVDSHIDHLHDAIIDYLGQLSRRPLNDEQTRLFQDYIAATGYFESMADIVEMNLSHAARTRIGSQLTVSPGTRQIIGEVWDKVIWAVDQAAHAVVDSSQEAAQDVIGSKLAVNALQMQAERHLARRISAPDADRLALFRMESDLVESAKRVHYMARRVAKRVVREPAGAGETSVPA